MKSCRLLKIKEYSAYYFLLLSISFLFSIDYGIDVLIDNRFSVLDNKRIGVLANSASIDKDGNHIIDILTNNDNFSLIKIFAPEHGFKVNYSAGEKFNNNSYNDIKVISLYGNYRKPLYSDISDLDLILIDIQDIGSTYYTYLSTVTYMLEAAAKYKISVIVLDRPNPMNRTIYGPKKEKFNFIGLHPIPIRHGMTIGELCYMINEEGWLSNKIDNLKIIKMRNFKEISDFNIWFPSSPNIPDLKTAFLYNGPCLFEGTNLSEGRGTQSPFQYIGAPWVNSKELVDYINNSDIKKYGSKIKIKEIEFIPKSNEGAKNPKYENQICYGVSIDMDKSLEPIVISLYLLEYFYNHYDEFLFNDNFFDILYGSSDFRKCLEDNDCNIEAIFNDIDNDVNEFNKVREKYLLY